MAKKEPEKVLLTKPKQVLENELNEEIKVGTELLERKVSTVEELESLQTEYVDWKNYCSELLKYAFNTTENEYAFRFSKLNQMAGFADSMKRGIDTNHPSYKLKMHKTKVSTCLNFLKRFVKSIKVIPTAELIETYHSSKGEFTNKGFIVHGHDDALKYEVARFLEKDLKKGAIILHEQANRGKTVIEKFETYSKVDFAIALWTNDDLGKVKNSDDLKPRARQNVIFETGFFLGKIGRENVIILHESGIEIPSDYSGVVYIAIEGNWKESLRTEIDAIYNL